MKLQLVVSSQRGDMITSKRPFLDWDVILATFSFMYWDIHVYYRVLVVIGQNQKCELLYQDVQDNKIETK